MVATLFERLDEIARPPRARAVLRSDFPTYLGEILAAPWPYQVERAAAWEAKQSEIILKARQIGVTELAAA